MDISEERPIPGAVAQAQEPSDSSAGDAAPAVRVDMMGAFTAFEWLDTHFSLLQFDLFATPPLAWKPCSKPWLELPWLCEMDQVLELRVYYDGSYVTDTDFTGAGAGCILWLETSWCHLDHSSTRSVKSILR